MEKTLTDIREASTTLESLLRYDLASMSVPGTDVVVHEGTDGWYRAEWERRDGEKRAADFLLRGDSDFAEVRVREGGAEISYPHFLSSTSMANLRSLARSVYQGLPKARSFVDPQAREESSEGDVSESRRASDLLKDLSVVRVEGATSLIFLTGGAGGGKTALLEHVVAETAEGYRRGDGGPLWLYVSAQGRRLAKLDDAVGRELGRMQAQFSFEAVATLVRCGVLILVIDGFDELLSIAGSYDESFSSLASFLDLLHGHGSVIAAARSAYYEQEFATRIDRAVGFRSEGWSLRRVRLLDWTPEMRRQYLQMRADEVGKADLPGDALDAVFSSPDTQELAGNPFFVTRAANLLILGTAFYASSGGLLESLVDRYLDREVDEKLRERAGRSYLTRTQLRDMLSEIADEMWRQDAPELSRTSVREVVSIVAELYGLDSDAQLALVDRTPYAAVLKAGTTDGSVTFEHDVYFAYFLASPLVAELRSSDRLRVRQALRRSQISPEAADFAGRLLADDAMAVIRLLVEACADDNALASQIRQNAGDVIAAIIRRTTPMAGLVLSKVRFIDCDLSNVELDDCDLNRCEFVGCDLRGSTFIGSAKHLTLERCKIDTASTRLEMIGLDVSSVRALQVWDGGYSQIVYDPARILSTLRDCGTPGLEAANLRSVDNEVLDVLDGLSALASKTNLFTEQDDTADVRRFASLDAWVRVRDAMVSEDLLRFERRTASGNKVFLRLKVALADLVAGRDRDASVSAQIQSFWNSIENSE